jgi:17beta-estradiol 17-dehydrogenase / very-long-chain 3-oxoacyl-CoA reductase
VFIPDFQVNKLIRCNIIGMDEMTRLILPQMVERKKGAVINLSSLSAAMCTPLLSIYSGTKAYVDK